MSTILTATALDIARTQIGVKEDGQANWGPAVANYLGSVGWGTPAPWCAAWVHWVFRQAARKCQLVNPVPKTASSRQIWALSEPICRVDKPTAGCVYVLRHSETSGHVGIVEEADEAGNVISEISGNTNPETGGREGICVARHYGDPAKTHHGTLIGYLDFDRAAQAPKVIG
jgi:uncharacterized protein (TIGR02594 family)